MAYRRENTDWNCSQCGFSNFRRRSNCKSCGAPQRGGGRSNRARGERRRKPGDWICPACNENNFRNRRQCFKCRAPKPEPGAVVREEAERREDRGERRRRDERKEEAAAVMEDHDFSRVEIAAGTFATLATGGSVEAIELNTESAIQSVRVEWHTGPSNGKANALFRESGSALLFIEELKKIQIGRRTLRAEDPVPFEHKGERLQKVHLQNVPPDYDDEMLTRAIDRMGATDFVEAYVFRRENPQIANRTADIVGATLKSMFDRFGLIRLKSHPPHFGTAAAILDFPDTDSCLAAIGELNNTPSELGVGRLKVKLDLRCIVQTTQEVWDVLQRDIDDLMHSIRRDRAQFPTVKIFLFGRERSATGVSRAVVCGSDAAAVCKARELYNNLMRPLVLYLDNDAVVHLVARQLNEYIAANDVRRVSVKAFPASGIIRVFGAPETRDRLNEFCQNLLTTMVPRSITKSPREIRLLLASNDFAGLNTGDNEFQVFVAANLRDGTIDVVGLNEEEVGRAVESLESRFVSEGGDDDAEMKPAGEGEALCGVCFMEIESGEASLTLESCSHVFHVECLTHQCKSALNVTGTRPLTCAQCQSPIDLKVVAQFLTLDEMTDFAKLCARDYLRTHPAEYKQCQTPDCAQIYPSNGTGLFNCSECLRQYCMTCRSPDGSIANYHAGMTCEGFQQSMNADESFAEFMKTYAAESTSKQCPYCHTMTDKFTNTCNHATCVYCKTHFCWKCLWVSPTDRFSGQLVYQHMTRAHGGWYR